MGILLARDFSKEAPGFPSAICGNIIPMALAEGNITEKQKKLQIEILKQQKKSSSLTGPTLGSN